MNKRSVASTLLGAISLFRALHSVPVRADAEMDMVMKGEITARKIAKYFGVTNNSSSQSMQEA